MEKGQTIAEVKEWEGKALEPVTIPIEKGMVQRFCRAVGDENPRWQEKAPPSLLLTIGFNEMVEELACGGLLTVLHGSTELEPYLDVSIGDVVTANAHIARVRERQGQMGATLFVTIDVECVNGRGEKVAMVRQVAIVY